MQNLVTALNQLRAQRRQSQQQLETLDQAIAALDRLARNGSAGRSRQRLRPEYRHPVRPSCSCVAGEGFSVPSVRTSASHKQGTRPPALLLLFAALDASAAGWILVAGTEGRDNQGLLQTGIIKVRQRLGRVLRLGTVTAVLISSSQQLK